MHLYIAYKNYSSWSLRPWILMKVAGIPFTETVLPFYHDDSLQQLAEKFTIPAQVPVLDSEAGVIWDSLAIMEYLAECFPKKHLWSQDQKLRSLARCASAEMHSGFVALRSAYPMNCRANKVLAPTEAVQQDLNRLAEIWDKFAQADKPAGDFLCGEFSIVDAMYAPVMWRVVGYNLDVSEDFAKWAKAMQALPAMQEWLQAAQAEEWVVEAYDVIGESLD